MEFFNPKEDVLDLQLTQYGKRLLKAGKFKPKTYAFYDDDILYDKKYGSGSHDHGQNDNQFELQNDSEPRIQEETPRTKVQYNFSGVESTIGSMDDQGIEMPSIQLNVEREYCLGVPMGNSALNSDYAPSWKLSYLYGELSASAAFLTGSSHGMLSIPQLDSSVEYKAYVTRIDDDEDLIEDYVPEELEDVKDLQQTKEEEIENAASDGTVMQIVPDFLLLEIGENNVEFLKENFDIEVFMLEDAKNNKGEHITIEKRLYFLEDPEQEVKDYHVEKYLDITVDEEIFPEYFCASDVIEERRKSLLTDTTERLTCPDKSSLPRNLYATQLESIGDPCDDE